MLPWRRFYLLNLFIEILVLFITLRCILGYLGEVTLILGLAFLGDFLELLIVVAFFKFFFGSIFLGTVHLVNFFVDLFIVVVDVLGGTVTPVVSD